MTDQNDFGSGIDSAKIKYWQKAAAYSDNKRVSIALIGEGRIHGEDDAIAMRPYQASLICNRAGGELLMLSRIEFYRTFKHSSESWRNAVKVSKIKELEYIKRCQNYLSQSR